jgi:hypothetical protein
MGTTNEIKETNIGQGLINKTCENCHKKITEKDVCENNNWDIQFDTSNKVKIEDNLVEGYNLTIWIRNIYHEDCDEAEEKEKTEWQKLGDKIKSSHPLETYNETLKKIYKIKKNHG